MAGIAFAGTVEIRLAGLNRSGREALGWNVVRIRTKARVQVEKVELRVEEGDEVGDLRWGERERRHALLRAAARDNRADLIAILIVAHDRGANQVRTASAGCILAMTGHAILLEGRAAALNRSRLGGDFRRTGCRWAPRASL